MSSQPTNDKLTEVNNLKGRLVSKTKDWVNRQLVEETNKMYGEQLDQQFNDSQHIMNQNQILRIASIQEQELNTRIIIAVAVFWIIILSAAVLVLFYFGAFPITTALFGIIGIWVIGFLYLGWYLYQHTRDPTATEFVNEAQEYTRAFIKAAAPDSLLRKCPEKCKLNYDTMKDKKPLPSQGNVGAFSRYPMDFDFWKGGVPSTDPNPKGNRVNIDPGASVRSLDNPLQTFTCVNPRTQDTVISSQPCDVYPGYEEQNEAFDWAASQVMFPRK